MAKEKKIKPKKIHKLFKKKYSPSHWERFLAKCYNTADKDKIVTYFEHDKKKHYVLRKNLTPEDTQALSDIVKRIELGYSFFQVWKLIAAGVVFVGVAVFLSVFQNRILENAIESGLSAIFQAKVDVQGVRLNIPQMSFRFRALTVGDSKEPYRNLFELGVTEIKLNPQALTLGRIVIDNAQSEDIRWNTPRTTSGILPSVQRREGTAAQQQEQATTNATPLFDTAAATMNVSNIIAAQRANLKSEATLRRANEEVSNTIDQWSKTYEQKNAQIAQLSTQASEIQRIQVGTIRTIEDAQRTLSQIDSFSKSVAPIGTDIKTTAGQFRITYDRAMQNRRAITEAINADKASIQGLIALPMNQGQSILQNMAGDFLRQRLGSIYTYGMRAWGYAQKLRSDPSRRPQRQRAQRLSGRNIPYPSDPYPSFLLKNLQSSVQTTERRFEGRVANISSDPYKWERPITLKYEQQEKAQNYSVNVSMDIRSNARIPLLAEFSGEGLPFEMSDLGFLRISNIRAAMKIESAFQWGTNRSVGTIRAVLSSLKMEGVDTADFITKMVAETLSDAGSIDFAIAYVMSAGEPMQITFKSSLDAVLQRKIGEYLNRKVREYAADIERELNAMLRSDLAKNEMLTRNLQGLNDISLRSVTDINTYERLVDTRKKEVQARIDQLRREQEDALRRRVQEAVPNVPNVPLPRIGN